MSKDVQYRSHVFSRVSDMLRRYEPSCVQNAELLMEEYLGKELELLSLLYRKYPDYAMLKEKGPVFKYRERLPVFCTRYIPDSVGIIDDVLHCYEGREEELFRHLVRLYGPELLEKENVDATKADGYATVFESEEIRERLVNFYLKYEPKKVANVDAIMLSFARREEILFERLTQLYGPMPPIPAAESLPLPVEGKADGRSSWRERLKTFFARFAPERSDEVEDLLQKFAGHEDALLYGLEAKYGSEPVPITQRNRARVAAFFLRAALDMPEESEIDKIIRAFSGSEEEFFFSSAATVWCGVPAALFSGSGRHYRY